MVCVSAFYVILLPSLRAPRDPPAGAAAAVHLKEHAEGGGLPDDTARHDARLPPVGPHHAIPVHVAFDGHHADVHHRESSGEPDDGGEPRGDVHLHDGHVDGGHLRPAGDFEPDEPDHAGDRRVGGGTDAPGRPHGGGGQPDHRGFAGSTFGGLRRAPLELVDGAGEFMYIILFMQKYVPMRALF